MIPSLIALLIVLASNLDVLVFVYACTVALLDAGLVLVLAVGLAVWVRLGFGA
jgi:hypothetical protein